jgi:hypothetical protein
MEQLNSWINTLKGYLRPKAVKDLDNFLDHLPKRAGILPLAIAGVVWVSAAGAILFTSTQIEQFQTIRMEMSKAEALTPTVPEIIYAPVAKSSIEPAVERMRNVYPNLTFDVKTESVLISGNTTRYYDQWRAAISHLSSIDDRWKLKIDNLCVGRECSRSDLFAEVNIAQVDIRTKDISNTN